MFGRARTVTRALLGRALGRLAIAPDFARGLDHQGELGGLIGRGDLVARRGARKAALRTQRELVEVDITRRFINPPLIPGSPSPVVTSQ